MEYTIPNCYSVFRIDLFEKWLRGSYTVWEINMGRLEFDNIMYIYCLWYDFYIYGTFEVYAIPLLIYDVMYYITTKP